MPDYKKLARRKISNRKIDQVSSKPKKFYRALAFLLILGLLIVGVSFGGRSFLLHFSGFKVSKVSIVDANGRPFPNPGGIFRLEDEANLFNFDMKRVAQDIQARHPELTSVLIRKQFPNTLFIIVKTRVPVAIVGMQKFCLVDEEGFILPFESIYGRLPKIAGIHPSKIQLYTKTHSLRLKAALTLLNELKKAKVCPEYKVSRIDVRQYSDIVFYLKNGIEVKMGQSDFGRKAALLNGILAQLKVNEAVPKYIDMRFDDPSVLP